MRFIRVLFIVLTLPTMSFGQEKTIRYRIDYLMRQDAVTSLYKIEVVKEIEVWHKVFIIILKKTLN